VSAARPGIAPVAVRLAPDGPAWTATLRHCAPPHTSDCAGGWEDGACECVVLVLEAGRERRALVLSESAALGRVHMTVVPRAARRDGPEGLWVAADLYDRRTPWPRVGWLIEGGPSPLLARRIELGSCRFEERGDPEEERAPAVCTPPETGVRYGNGGALVVTLPSGERTFGNR
jgi:hypothetical protein